MGTPFRNSVLAGEELIRDAIRSANFSIGDTVTGWRIARDGSATFFNVTIGAPGWFIDENGNASFNDVSVSGDITIGGDTLTNILDSRGRGIIARGISTADSPISTLTEVGVLELAATFEDGRMYRVATTTLALRSSVANDDARSLVRYRSDGLSPDLTSNILISGGGRIATANNDRACWVLLDTVLTCDDSQAADGIVNVNSGVQRFLLTVQRMTGTGNVIISTGGGTLNPITLYVEDLGNIVPNTGITSGAGGGGTPPTEQFIKTYNAVWTASWYGFGKRSSQRLYQGDTQLGDGTGNQYSKIGFPYSTIQTDLAGSTIDKVEVRVSNEHSWNNSGLTARFGTHNNDTEPSGSSSTSGTFNDTNTHFNKGQTKFVTLANSVGTGFRDNTIKGITMGRTNAGDRNDYGYFYGEDATSSRIPQLRITYTK